MSKKILLVPDCATWAWSLMCRGIVKYAPADYDVYWMDQSAFNVLIRECEPTILPLFDGVCHFSWCESPLPGGKRSLPINRLSTLVASHGFEFPYPHESNELPALIATKNRNRSEALRRLPKFESVLCVSKRIYEACQHFTKNSRRVIPGVDHEAFTFTTHPSREKLRVGWCGQRAEDGRNNTKGFTEVLVPLIDRLQDKVNFIINPRTAQNALSQAEMFGWYSGLDLILSTSSSEGFQMPLLEAASCGRAAIATDVGGANELITHGENGFIVPAYRDAESAKHVVDLIAERLLKLSSERETVRSIGLAARDRVLKEFTWERRAPEWLAHIGG